MNDKDAKGHDTAAAIQAEIDRLSRNRGAGGAMVLTPGRRHPRGTIVASTLGVVLTPGEPGGPAVVLQVPNTPAPRPEPPRPRPSVRLHAVGGLCNRASAILGYRSMHGPIDVLWASDEYVSHARFSDVFDPLEGVTFYDEGEYTVQDYAPPADVSPGWERAYTDLRPVEAIANAIAVHREALGDNYVAIHVRRTDMVPLAEWLDLSLTTDEQFREFVDRHAPLPVYLATDNGETQRRFVGDPRVRINVPLDGVEIHEGGDHHRNGSLADAVIDMFVCAGATHFLGAGFGTFSHTIELLRKLR